MLVKIIPRTIGVNWYNIRQTCQILRSKSFATSSTEYEIDIISLTKTPKPNIKVKSSNNHFNKHKKNLIDFQSNNNLIDKKITEKIIKDVNYRCNGRLTEFIDQYSHELSIFAKFIRKSYNCKIKHFNQLTNMEILNSLYIFKDLYHKGKIDTINIDQHEKYDNLFYDFLKIIEANHDLPSLLDEYIFLNKHGVELLSNNLGNYSGEIRSLNKEFNFKNLHDMQEISKSIQLTVDDFNKFLINNNNLYYNEEFFKIFIQIQKYKNLSHILSNEIYQDLSPLDLLYLIESKNFQSISKILKDVKPFDNLEILKFLLPVGDLTILQIIEKLHHLKTVESLSIIEPHLTNIYNNLINSCCNGNLSYFNKLDIEDFTKFIVSNNIIENFEFSMIYKLGLYQFVNELKILKSMNIDLSNDGLVSMIHDLNFKNIVLKSNFEKLSHQLKLYFAKVTWSTNSLDNLITFKNWYDWCEENRESKIFRELIDYSNLSNYSYPENQLMTELSELLPTLHELSISNENVNLSAMSIDYIISLFEFDKVNLDLLRQYSFEHGNVYLSNLGNLTKDYNQLFENLSFYDLKSIKQLAEKDFKDFSKDELTKYFGYYSDLIENPLILDNLENLNFEKRRYLFDSNLSGYANEIEHFWRYELDGDYLEYSKIDLITILRRRINEVLSNPTKVDNSEKDKTTMNLDNIQRYIELTEIIEKYGSDESFDLLDNFVPFYEPENSTKDNHIVESEFDVPLELEDLKSFSPELKILHKYFPDGFNRYSQEEILHTVRQIIMSDDISDVDTKNNFATLYDTLANNDNWISDLQKILDKSSFAKEKFEAIKHSRATLQEYHKFKHNINGKIGISTYFYYLRLLDEIPPQINTHDFMDRIVLFNTYKNEIYHGGPDIEDVIPVLHNMIFDEVNHSVVARKILHQLIEDFNIFYRTHGNYETLDKLYRSFDDLYQVYEYKKEYIQVPDFIPIHEFVSELTSVREEMFRDFKYYSASEILIKVDEFVNDPTDPTLSLDFNKLFAILTQLFKYNGNNTEILDKIITDNQEYLKFQTKLDRKAKEVQEKDTSNEQELNAVKEGIKPENMPKNKEIQSTIYQQVPDNFQLEEYYTELFQLRNVFGTQFANCQAKDILNQLNDMSSDERRFNLAKRIIFSKLYGNLVRLFKHNGNQTFILDNILINNEVFQTFEHNKGSKVIRDSDKFNEFLNEHFDQLTTLFSKIKLDKYELIDFYELKKDDNDKKCSKFLDYVKENNNYEYVQYVYLVKKLEKMIELDGLTLPILKRLLYFKSNSIAWDSGTLKEIRNEINNFTENIRKNKDLFSNDEIEVSTEVPIEKFDINDFKSTSHSGLDSEPAVKSITESPKNTGPVVEQVTSQTGLQGKYNDPRNIKIDESTAEDSDLFARNQLFHSHTYPNTMAVESIRSNYGKSMVDEDQLQNDLESIKQEKLNKEEELFRTKNAYEWSKNDRKLESQDFFNPLEYEEYSNLVQNDVDVDYLLLTIDGKKITTNENPLKNHDYEDMISVLNKFPSSEMNKFIKHINRLTRKNWRLIGGFNDNEKFLVFIKSKPYSCKTFIGKLKSLFAFMGATFMSLMMANWWLDEVDQPTITLSPTPETVQKSTSNSIIIDEPPSAIVDQRSDTEVKPNAKVGWFWK